MKDPQQPIHLSRDEHSRNEQTVLAQKIANIPALKRAVIFTRHILCFSISISRVYHIGIVFPLPPTGFVAR